MGLLKKIILADPLASYSDVLFNMANAAQGQSLVVSWGVARKSMPD
jgi:hypothetical protein